MCKQGNLTQCQYTSKQEAAIGLLHTNSSEPEWSNQKQTTGNIRYHIIPRSMGTYPVGVSLIAGPGLEDVMDGGMEYGMNGGMEHGMKH